jgi:hypothetical protein
MSPGVVRQPHRSALFGGLRLPGLLRATQPVQALFIISDRQQLLLQVQVPFARFRRPAHAGEAMVLSRHRPVFGCTHHRLLPRTLHLPGSAEQTAWDARRVPTLEFCNENRTHSFAFRVVLILHLWRDKVERFVVAGSATAMSGSRHAFHAAWLSCYAVVPSWQKATRWTMPTR